MVNFFDADHHSRGYFNYECRLFWDLITYWPLDSFSELPSFKQKVIIEKLLQFWIDVYSTQFEYDLLMVVDVNQIDMEVSRIASFISIQAPEISGNTWKRKNADKRLINLPDYVDLRKYKNTVYRLGYSI